MTWTKQDDGSGPSWFSGIYKITRYDKYQDVGIHYRAYYIKQGHDYWGSYVNALEPYYLTLRAAQAACDTHLKETHVEVTTRR